jgi:hypothetical protein
VKVRATFEALAVSQYREAAPALAKDAGANQRHQGQSGRILGWKALVIDTRYSPHAPAGASRDNPTRRLCGPAGFNSWKPRPFQLLASDRMAKR